MAWRRHQSLHLMARLVVVLVTALLACSLVRAQQTSAPRLTNPGFELGEGLEGWSIFSGTPDLSSQARTGEYSLRLDDPSSEQAIGLRSEPIAIQPGALYNASVWIRTEGGTAQLYLEFWDAGGTRIDVVFDGASGATWRSIRLERRAPADAVAATLLLYGHRGNVGVAHFDDAELVRVDESEVEALHSTPKADVLAPQMPTWNDRPSAQDRIAQGFDVKVSSHPRLYVTKEDLPRIRERMAGGKNSFGVDLQQMLTALQTAAHQHRLQTQFTLTYYGNHAVTYDLPPKQPETLPNPPQYVAGRYPFWTAMASHLRGRLQNLAGAYLFTGDPVFVDAAKRDILALATWDVWSDPSYDCGGLTCLDTGYIVEGVAFAYDVLYEVFTADERKLIRTALVDKGLKPLYADTARKVDHNIHMVRTAALGTGALLLLGEEPGMEQYLARAYENFFWYLDQRIDTGATEGMLYTSVSMDHIAQFADALERVTGDRSMFDHPYVKHVLPYWVIYGYGPRASGHINFSDSYLTAYFFNTMLAIARVNDLPQANWYVATSGAGAALGRLLRLDPDAKVEAPPTDWPTSRVFADIGWALLRSGWQAHDTLLGFVSSGSRMGHNHFDQNHFVLNVGGEWLIKDNGYQDYNPGPKNDMTNRTLGHNAVLIDGQGQTAKGGGELVASFLSRTVDYVAGDATAAYGGTGLQGWVRHLLYLKPSQVVILDEFLLRDEGAQPALLIHPNGQVMVDDAVVGPGFSGQLEGFDIRRGGVGATAHMLWPTQQKTQMRTTPGAEEYGPYLVMEPTVSGRRVVTATLLDIYSLDQVRQFAGDYKVTSLDVTQDSGRSFLRTQDGLLYRAEGAGDRLEVTFDVPAPGRYHLAIGFATSPTYGAVQADVDGNPMGHVIDTYTARLGETELIDLGEVELGVGKHTLGLTVVDRHQDSRGDFVLLQRLQLLPTDDAAVSSVDAAFTEWKELASGRRVSSTDANEQRLRFETATDAGRDLVWLSLNADAGDIASEQTGIATDGANAWVSVDRLGQVRRYAMSGGQALRVDGEALIQSDTAVNVSLASDEANRWILEADAAVPAKLAVWLPAACVMATAPDGSEWRHQLTDGMLTLSIPEGRTELVLTACE